MSLEALEMVVTVLAAALIVSVVYELARWTLRREADRIDRHERELIRRRYGRPDQPTDDRSL